MKNIASIVLFAACLVVVHAEVETLYSDATCTTAKTAPDTKSQTWTGSGLCKTVVSGPPSSQTTYRKFVCSGTAVAMNLYSDNTCSGTASTTYDVTTNWPKMIAGECWSTGSNQANKFDAVLSASSWGEDCGTGAPTTGPPTSAATFSCNGRPCGNSAGRAAPMTLFLATVCLAARLVF